MTTTTLTKTPRTLVASGSNAAGSTTRGTLDLRTAQGGLLTLKITNGATGPTVQCQANILAAHNSGSTPAAASAGADWKTLWGFGGGTIQCPQAAGAAPRAPGQRVRLRVQARDVSLTLGAAQDTSILNVLPATVQSLAEDGPAQMLVALDLAGTPLLARVTRKSAEALDLAPGRPVYAQIMGVAVLD